MNSRLLRIAPLLFASGFCALVYQTTWLREFRLFFGASTAANAAVLGIFMGGLGAGSAVLGRRSESKEHPLAYYAKLELFIAASVALTPILLWLAAHLYLALGGTLAMGLGLGSVVRLLLSAFVLGVPTFLMGGTLPAVARAAVGEEDTNRRSLALLYGVNTLGAVTGTAAATFYFFEAWGNTLTLVLAVAFNMAVALAAFSISKSLPPAEKASPKGKVAPEEAAAAPPKFVFVASAVAGFAFLLMELVWYRMLSPLLGGSAFTFGLILAVALLGIGLGGVAYAVFLGNRRITLQAFALTCALEAVCIALPYALGDRIALGAMLLRPLGTLGFHGFVIGWTQLCLLVVLPAAIVAGVQFPMLIALLGKGKTRVGSQTGMAYAWNTAGAIAGSLAGGFGFLPAFSAPGVWRLVVILLGALALAAAVIDLRRRANPLRLLPPFAMAALALWMLTAVGPTAFWRHGEIGVGRQEKFTGTKNEFRDLMNTIRRSILWETDGVESSVAVSKDKGIAFIVNGRIDGSLKGDTGTQIMSGLIPAVLHPLPKRALVVGLGTGSTAGWLAAVPSMERVDVAELEPAILKVAEQSAPMNEKAMQNPKMHVIIGDAREILLAAREKYDLIVSEPSNPYRAGIASLFTREYYQAALGRLNPGGMFAQWVQAYEVDNHTVQTVYATIGAVFPNVETWQTDEGDMLLVGSAAPRTHDAAELRQRVAREPFKRALRQAWRATDLEAFLAHFVADNSIAQAFRQRHQGPLNTDDQTVLEFAFARNVDLQQGFRLPSLRLIANVTRADRLPLTGELDVARVNTGRMSMLLAFEEAPEVEDYGTPELRSLAAAYASFVKGDLVSALARWKEHPREPRDLNELLLVAECMAHSGAPEADGYIEKLRTILPTDAGAISARLLLRRGQYEQATAVLEDVFRRLQTDPWPSRDLTGRTLLVAQQVAENARNDQLVRRLYQALRAPFSVYNSEESRLARLFRFALMLEKSRPGEQTQAAIAPTEPHIPWQELFLKVRKASYAVTANPRLAVAERDLREFLKARADRLEEAGLTSKAAPPAAQPPRATPAP